MSDVTRAIDRTRGQVEGEGNPAGRQQRKGVLEDIGVAVVEGEDERTVSFGVGSPSTACSSVTISRWARSQSSWRAKTSTGRFISWDRPEPTWW